MWVDIVHLKSLPAPVWRVKEPRKSWKNRRTIVLKKKVARLHKRSVTECLSESKCERKDGDGGGRRREDREEKTLQTDR